MTNRRALVVDDSKTARVSLQRMLEKHNLAVDTLESAQQALEYARDTYTRRGEGVSIWVVKASDIVASQAGDAASFFDAQDTKPYRHAGYYRVPDEVKNL